MIYIKYCFVFLGSFSGSIIVFFCNCEYRLSTKIAVSDCYLYKLNVYFRNAEIEFQSNKNNSAH